MQCLASFSAGIWASPTFGSLPQCKLGESLEGKCLVSVVLGGFSILLLMVRMFFLETLGIIYLTYFTPPKFNISPLKNGGWKTTSSTFLLGFGNFSGSIIVKLQGCTSKKTPRNTFQKRQQNPLKHSVNLDRYPSSHNHGSVKWAPPIFWLNYINSGCLGRFS